MDEQKPEVTPAETHDEMGSLVPQWGPEAPLAVKVIELPKVNKVAVIIGNVGRITMSPQEARKFSLEIRQAVSRLEKSSLMGRGKKRRRK